MAFNNKYDIRRDHLVRTSAPRLGSVGARRISDWLGATVFGVGVVIWASFSGTWHWSIVPIAVSGTLISVDVVAWARGKIQLFDPVGFIGLVGINFYCIAPMIHVTKNVWRPFHGPVDLEWIGGLATLNVVGLCLYRATLYMFRPNPFSRSEISRVPNWSMFSVLLYGFLGLTFLMQVYIYARLGGVEGYISAYEQRGVSGQLEGMGWMFMIAESFPILALLGWAVYEQQNGRSPSWFVILVVLAAYVVLQIGFGGLRGSRGNTIYPLFWAAGVIHFTLRPLTKKHIIIGIAFCLLFMSIYEGFKKGGVEGLVASITGTNVPTYKNENSADSFAVMLVSDLARADPQARVLSAVTDGSSDYQFAMGQTYLGAIALLIPKQIWSDRPPRKGYFGSLAMYGNGTTLQSSTPYGVTGEAMLNFGVAGGITSFVLLALVVVLVRRFMVVLPRGDIRWLLLPLYINVCLVFLAGDADNTIFFFAKQGFLALVLVYGGSVPRRIAVTR